MGRRKGCRGLSSPQGPAHCLGAVHGLILSSSRPVRRNVHQPQLSDSSRSHSSKRRSRCLQAGSLVGVERREGGEVTRRRRPREAGRGPGPGWELGSFPHCLLWPDAGSKQSGKCPVCSEPPRDGNRGSARSPGLLHARALCAGPRGVVEAGGTRLGHAWSP